MGAAFVWVLGQLPPLTQDRTQVIQVHGSPCSKHLSTPSDVPVASGAWPFSFLGAGPACLFTMDPTRSLWTRPASEEGRTWELSPPPSPSCISWHRQLVRCVLASCDRQASCQNVPISTRTCCSSCLKKEKKKKNLLSKTHALPAPAALLRCSQGHPLGRAGDTGCFYLLPCHCLFTLPPSPASVPPPTSPHPPIRNLPNPTFLASFTSSVCSLNSAGPWPHVLPSLGFPTWCSPGFLPQVPLQCGSDVGALGLGPERLSQPVHCCRHHHASGKSLFLSSLFLLFELCLLEADLTLLREASQMFQT
ncbi:uncharacterized protein LOC121479740 isoform X2 [Vulpes lagopus]|uniref:uncharacterized protein LOC121479740 isoform X2 n=1 Tax=Vulpes lagopus TaxID=494514 RepID=UPI001BCA2417|nr:uncharacterized protein LOC121479740 isoform X2 [Vulpes lagopus]